MAEISDVLVVAMRVAAILAAIALFYATFLLYEDETEILRSRIESLWIYSTYFPDRLRTKVMRAAAGALNTLNRLFGKRLLSIQSVSVSWQLCNLSWWIANSIMFSKGFWGTVYIFLGSLAIGVFVCLQAGARSLLLRSMHYAVSMCFLLIAIYGVLSFLPPQFKYWYLFSHLFQTPFFPAQFMSAFVATFVDLSVIAIARLLLRRGLESGNQWKIIWASLINFLFGAALIVVPLYVSWRASASGDLIPMIMREEGPPLRIFLIAAISFPWGNFFTLIPVLVFSCLSVVLILDSMLFPLFSRLIYSIHRYDVLEKRKSLFIAACGLVILAVPQSATIVTRLKSFF